MRWPSCVGTDAAQSRTPIKRTSSRLSLGAHDGAAMLVVRDEAPARFAHDHGSGRLGRTQLRAHAIVRAAAANATADHATRFLLLGFGGGDALGDVVRQDARVTGGAVDAFASEERAIGALAGRRCRWCRGWFGFAARGEGEEDEQKIVHLFRNRCTKTRSSVASLVSASSRA